MARGTGCSARHREAGVTAAMVPTNGDTPISATGVRDQIRAAAAEHRALRIVGGGLWLDANRPVRAERSLPVRGLSGIVEYEPGDLTLTAKAGTTLDEIDRVTAPQGQWLTLDPPGDASRATIGATVATASYGPLAHHFGTPRDLTLGVEFVTGVGDIVRGGGRVVKNVAGFDLTRLVTGAWGSLGVLTEATVRLRALPAVESTLVVDVPENVQEIERVRAGLRRLPFIPLAAALLDATIAISLVDAAHGAALLVRLGGNEEAVRAQREQLRTLGDVREADGNVWQKLRIAEPSRAAAVRLSRKPSLFAETWSDASRIALRVPGAFALGDPGRGTVRLVLPLGNDSAESDLSAILDIPFDGSRIYERLPARLWSALAPQIAHGRLERDIKAAFDPHHVLNPGILGELQ
jgi:glycolate oxidase FAD binding subunit